MKKNNLYVIIGLAAAGSLYYYMKNQQTKKEEQKKKIEETTKLNQLKKIVNVVKKISKPVIKKPAVKTTDNIYSFQSNLFNEAQKSLLTRPVKKEAYKFPFLRPKTVGNFPDTF